MIDFWIFPLSTIWGAYQKQGIPGQNKEKQNNDKSTICLPRQCLMDAVKAQALKDFLMIDE